MRYVLLDRITALEPPARARRVKCVSCSDDVFDHHFQGLPVMPGALIVEAMAQLSGVLVEAAARQAGGPERYALLTTIERAQFRQLVQPGDRLDLEATAVHLGELGGSVRTTASVEGALVSQAELTFALADLPNEKLVQQRREQLALWLRRVGLPEPQAS